MALSVQGGDPQDKDLLQKPRRAAGAVAVQ